MFDRKIEKSLLEWKQRADRRPLVIRGARQCGKTTVIRKFAQNFESFIELNLEKDADKKIFSEIRDVRMIIQSIEGFANKRIIPGKTLLFIDEIQNSVQAIKLLRYFYEEAPGIHVVSAGSLLEVRMKNEGWSFPVGRVEFLYLYPTTFEEYLQAKNEDVLLETLRGLGPADGIAPPLHDRLVDLLSEYFTVGGMPAAVNEYLTNFDILNVRKYHAGLVQSFKEDFAKYSKASDVDVLKDVWDIVPFEVGKRLKYSRLGGGKFSSRAVSNAFDVLHSAMLVDRIFPSTSLRPPTVRKEKAAPKVLFLDIGLATHVLHISRDQIKEKLMNPVFEGGLFEAFAGQELLASDLEDRKTNYFWVREEKGASSETDFLLEHDGNLVPVEVKSGSQGSLKSLHQFLSRSGFDLGVRFYNGQLAMDALVVTLPNGVDLKYRLFSIPFYLIFRLKEILSDVDLKSRLG